MDIRRPKISVAGAAIASLAISVAVVAAASSAAHAAIDVTSHEEFIEALDACEKFNAGYTCEVRITEHFTVTDSHPEALYEGDANVVIMSPNGAVIMQGGRADERRFVAFKPKTHGAQLTLQGLTLKGFGHTTVSTGGTVYFRDAHVIIADTVIENSRSGGSGGAVGGDRSSVTVNNSYFRGNESNHSGGAIYTTGKDSRVTINGSVFDGNWAKEAGGAIRLSSTTTTVTNSTFVNNTTERLGGAFMMQEGAHTIAFSTFHRNGADEAGAHFYNNLNTTLTIRASVIGETVGSAQPCGGSRPSFNSGGHNAMVEADCAGAVHPSDLVSQDRLTFFPLADHGGDHPTLMPHYSNPVIDAIAPTACAVRLDQRGVKRPQGRGCEIGAVEVGPSPFSDVPMSHPFAVHILWLAGSGVTGGYDDGTFRPSATVSRQAMAAFLYRFLGEPVFHMPATATFTDVPTTHQFFEEIEWLAGSGIATGYGDGTFRPTATVSRQAMAAFLYRAVDEPAFDATGGGFTDVPDSHEFSRAIRWVVKTAVATGYEDGTYRPSSAVSRQAMAAFLARLNDLPR